MSESITVGINKLSLKPGDVLVVHMPKYSSIENIEYIKDFLPKVLPDGVKTMVCADIGLTVLRNDVEIKPEPAEIDESITVEVKT